MRVGAIRARCLLYFFQEGRKEARFASRVSIVESGTGTSSSRGLPILLCHSGQFLRASGSRAFQLPLWLCGLG